MTKKRVNILPKRIKHLSSKFSTITLKNHFRCNYLRVASKVLGKHVSSQHFRCSVQSIRIPARFVTFSSQREENHGVEPVQPGSSRCPPDICIWSFKSGRFDFSKQKGHPSGCPFVWRYRPDLNWRMRVLQAYWQLSKTLVIPITFWFAYPRMIIIC